MDGRFWAQGSRQGLVPVGLLKTGEPVSVFLMGKHGDDATVLRCM